MSDSENSERKVSIDKDKASFHGELYRRDLFRVSVVYVLVGLLIWKAAVLLTPVFDLPDQTSRVAAIFIILLFPFAIVLAWVFEMAPGGFVRVGSDESKKNPYDRTRRKPLTSSKFILLLAILVVILYVFFPEW